jgi:uncharacterized RDD family membrane protein YckC
VTGTVLDTIVPAETPEGIVLELRPAGLCSRSCAFLMDMMIRIMIFGAIATVSGFLGTLAPAVYLIILFALEWLYPVAFELTRWGATPGKRALGLKVVMDNGLPVTPAASFTRNLLRAADFLPLMYGFALICLLLRRDFKRLGDMAAATLVVYEAREARRLQIAQAEPLAPAIPVALQDQAAVIALAARAARLTSERLDELAALAAPVSGDVGRSGPEVTRRVLGVAQWFLGRRVGAPASTAAQPRELANSFRGTG